MDIRCIDRHDPPPNAYRLTLSNARERHTMIAMSTGGGMIEGLEIDGQRVALCGGAHVEFAGRLLHPVLSVLSHPGAALPFHTCTDLLTDDAGRGIPLWQWAVGYEAGRARHHAHRPAAQR